MKRNKNQDIQQLTQEITEINRQMEHFRTLEEATLRHRPRPEAWSVLDCVEHLNLFCADYFPRIEKSLRTARLSGQPDYRPGFFGTRMFSALQPQNGERKQKVKTFKKMVPQTDKQAPAAVLDTFLGYQAQLQAWIASSEQLDWEGTRVASAIGPILNLKLGDCFRLIVAHTQRHILQAEEVLEGKKDSGLLSDN